MAPRYACMEPAPCPPPPAPADAFDSDLSEDSGDETVPSDPEKWQQRDVLRCVRWVARTFSVRAPRRHLLPGCGPALLSLTLHNWTQVCSGCEQAARIYHTYVQHAHAAAKGRAPPAPLPEHQQSAPPARDARPSCRGRVPSVGPGRGGAPLGPAQAEAQHELRQAVARAAVLLRQEHHEQGARQEIRVPVQLGGADGRVPGAGAGCSPLLALPHAPHRSRTARAAPHHFTLIYRHALPQVLPAVLPLLTVTIAIHDYSSD